MKDYPKIIAQRQPNRHACYPTCVSILTGIPLDKIFEVIGHDGSDGVGFEYNEIALASLLLGWSLICLSEYEFDSLIENLSSDKLVYRMILCIKKSKSYHAVAWDGKSDFVIDPLLKNQFVPLRKIKKRISTIEILVPVEKRKMTFSDTDKISFNKI